MTWPRGEQVPCCQILLHDRDYSGRSASPCETGGVVTGCRPWRKFVASSSFAAAHRVQDRICLHMAITDEVSPRSSAVKEVTAGRDTRPIETFRRARKQYDMNRHGTLILMGRADRPGPCHGPWSRASRRHHCGLRAAGRAMRYHAAGL